MYILSGTEPGTKKEARRCASFLSDVFCRTYGAASRKVTAIHTAAQAAIHISAVFPAANGNAERTAAKQNSPVPAPAAQPIITAAAVHIFFLSSLFSSEKQKRHNKFARKPTVLTVGGIAVPVLALLFTQLVMVLLLTAALSFCTIRLQISYFYPVCEHQKTRLFCVRR